MSSAASRTEKRKTRLSTLGHALFFVGGFSMVFILGWGGGATLFGQLFSQYKYWIGRIGGIVVILFGLVTIGVIHIPWLLADTRPHVKRRGTKGLISSGLFGVLFAAGWTPCIGATLGAILTLGISLETAGQAMLLSSGYALGLGLPFLGLAVLLDRAMNIIHRVRVHVRTFQWISGILIITIGILMITNRITYIAIWAQQNGFFLDLPLGGASAPTYLASMAAGLLSFLSPCVLPLVPAYLGYLSGQGALAPAHSE